MGFLRALWILTYKNVRFRARHWLFTVGEVAVPLLLFYAVVYAKKSYPTVFGQSVRKNETFFPPVSEQTLFQEPFLQGTLHLLYTPPTNFTTELIQLVAVILKTRSYSKVSVSVVGVADESEMESRFFKLYHNKSRELATNPNASLPSGLGIVFQDLPFDGCEPLHLNYKIRPASNQFNTEELFQESEIPAEQNSPYVRNSFLPVYLALNFAYIYQKTGAFMPRFYLGPLPLPSYQHTVNTYDVITFFLPAVTIGSFLILIPLLIKNIVLEKETGGKELMRMMGYRNWMLWFGWLLNTLTVCCFSAAMISFLMVTDVFCSGPIFQMLDGSVLFVFLLLYCLVIIFFCFALSPIFSTCANIV